MAVGASDAPAHATEHIDLTALYTSQLYVPQRTVAGIRAEVMPGE